MRPLLVETARRVMTDAGESFTQALWDALEAQGLPDAAVTEGADWGDAMAILRVAGAQALPAPLGETMIARWLLASSGLSAPPGPLAIAPVEAEPLTLARRGKGWRLEGSARRVPWARAAAAVVVVAQGFVAVVPAGIAAMTQGADLADEPRDDVAFAADLAADAAAPCNIAWDVLFARGALMRAAMMAGALETVLEMTVRYTGERVQFGRPIARFQAIQQQVAQLAAQVASAAVAADAAAAAPDDSFLTAVAKTRAGEAAGPVAAIAHQVHGAMGFAREHRLNLFTRRLWSWRDEFGDEAHWARVLGRAAAHAGGAGLWPLVAGKPE
jgi:acyl-CoA dehydrogenase